MSVDQQPMRFAYADPPYHGMGAKMYGPLHAEAHVWDDRQAHIELVNRLCDEYPDGWALSCNPRDLRWLLPETPDDVRVCVWTKTYHQIRPSAVQYAWEPVLLRGGRVIKGRNPLVRDWWQGNANRGLTGAKAVPGSKPPEFCRWVLDLLGHQEGDTLDDLFPGSGVMADVLAQTDLFDLGGIA